MEFWINPCSLRNFRVRFFAAFTLFLFSTGPSTVNVLRLVVDACARSLLSPFGRESRKKSARRSASLLTLAGIAAVLAATSGCGGGGSSSPEQGGDQGTTPPPPPPPSVFAVATYHNDNLRSGINSQETTLTPS